MISLPKKLKQKHVVVLVCLLSVLLIGLVFLLVSKSSSLADYKADYESAKTELATNQNKVSELSAQVTQLAENNEELINKVSELEELIEDSQSSSATSHTPIPSLKSACGDVPLPITQATPSQKACFDEWHKKYISN